MPSYDYAELYNRHEELTKDYMALQNNLLYAKRDLQALRDVASDLEGCLIAKAHYDSRGKECPLWLTVKIEDLTERLVHCD